MGPFQPWKGRLEQLRARDQALHSRLNRAYEVWGGCQRTWVLKELGMKQQDEETKYIFVTGGVVSSLGKGLTARLWAPCSKAEA